MRQQLSQTERIKLQNNAEKGIETKYDLLDQVNLSDVETLKAVYSMSIRTGEMKSEMARYDMHGVMTIPSTVTYNADEDEYFPAQGASPIDMFNNAAEVEIDLVKHVSEWMMKYGASYHAENLFWTAAKILNSCSDRL